MNEGKLLMTYELVMPRQARSIEAALHGVPRVLAYLALPWAGQVPTLTVIHVAYQRFVQGLFTICAQRSL